MNVLALALALCTTDTDWAFLPEWPVCDLQVKAVTARRDQATAAKKAVRALLGYESYAGQPAPLCGTAAFNMGARLEATLPALDAAERDLDGLARFWKDARRARSAHTSLGAWDWRERAKAARRCREYLKDSLFKSRAWWPHR